MNKQEFDAALAQEIEQMCKIALAEDLNSPQGQDITADLIPEDTQATATLITRESMIVCGVAWLNKIFELLGDDVKVDWLVSDGDLLEPNATLCKISGNARKLLTGERAALNFIQSLSATATLTQQYVTLIKHTQCRLLDTRKTIPGMRYGQKYAVQCGGGQNHRLGLHDAYLIKENHIMACGGISQSLSKAKALHPGKLVEIEVESIDELEQAIEGGADIIMLDNFNIQDLKHARELVQSLSPNIKLEASGNINIQTISQIAATGIDFISVGGLTKNILAIDLSLRINLII